MTFYEQIVNEVQMSNYSRYYNVYASGRTVVPLTKKEPLHYEEQIQDFVQKVKDADCVIVGGASGLSAAGGGDFYYGLQDEVLNIHHYENSMSFMPDNFTEDVIEGGNHAQFGDYGKQKGDGEAEIPAKEQWDETVTAIVDFMERDR